MIFSVTPFPSLSNETFIKKKKNYIAFEISFGFEIFFPAARAYGEVGFNMCWVKVTALECTVRVSGKYPKEILSPHVQNKTFISIPQS